MDANRRDSYLTESLKIARDSGIGIFLHHVEAFAFLFFLLFTIFLL